MAEGFGGVAFCFYRVPDLFDFAAWTDEERGTGYAFEDATHEFFRAPGAVGFDHFVSGVAE